MGRRRSAGLLLAAALALSGGCASRALHLEPCVLDGVAGARCGSLMVAENRAATARRIPMRIVVLDPTGSSPRPEPIFFLSGGPGQAATDSIARIAEDYAQARRSAALVFVDQRGTGGSNALPCRPFAETDMRRFFGDGADPDGLLRCRAELETHADLRQYTTAAFIDDLEEVRRALHVDRVDLDGGSYGTRVALEYIRRYPQHVRSAVLQGVSPADYALPLPFAAAGQRALDLWLDACARDASCTGRYGDVRTKLASLLSRLERSPAAVTIRNPITGKDEPVLVTRDRFAKYLHLLLLAGPLATRIPMLVDAADRGDLQPFVELVVMITSRFGDLIAYGMQLSVACNEDVPFIDEAQVARDRSATFLRDVRVREIRDACRVWPRGPDIKEWGVPVVAGTPVLILSGERDPVTPPEIAARVAARLPNARLVVVPGGTHINSHPCIQELVTAFLEKADASQLRTDCVAAMEPPRFE